MRRQPGKPIWRVVLTPRSENIDLDVARDRLVHAGGFRFAVTENGVIELSVTASNVDAAEERVRKLVERMGQDGHFIIGHPPL